MAKYGTRRYGAGFRYGEPSPVGVYYEANLIATSIDYGTVQITWGNILIDPADTAPTHWRLVKSYVGSLDNPDDGTRLTGGLFSQFKNSYTDTALFSTSQEVHYSLWVFNGVKWILCGQDYEIIVENTDTLATVTRWIPKAWLNPTNTYIGDGIGEDENNTFYKVLGAYTFVYDQLRASANLLNLASNPIYTPSAILRHGVVDQGHTYEPTLGDSYHRSLYGAGNIINAYKGTPLGIGVYATALTHWANDVEVGHNLMLDYNDSSFEESIGRWSTSRGTLEHKDYASDTVVTPDKTHILYDPIFKPRMNGFGQLTVSGSSDVVLTLPDALDIRTYGIPVKENTRYIFSGQVLDRDTQHGHVVAQITWYDMFGTSISTTPVGTDLVTSSDWQEFTSKSDSGRNGSLSPRGAKFAKITITISPANAASKRFVFDCLQFAEATKSYEYQDAKLITVAVTGEKENYLPNSSFEDGLFGWKTLNADAYIDDSTTLGITTYGVHGTKAVKLVATGDDAALISDWSALDAGTTVTFSSYVLATVEETAVARIEFSSLSTEEAQTSVLSDTEGQYYPTTNYIVESDPFTLSTTSPTQISVTAISPPYSKDTGYPLAKVTILFPNSTNGEVFYIDGAMLESKSSPSRFFSGLGGILPDDASTQQYYSPDFTRWETKNIYNYISNPSFITDTTGWTSTGTLTRVTSDNGYTPLYGATFGKVAYTTSTTLTGIAHLPYEAKGGEDFIVSAYVRGAVATYTMNGTSYTILPGEHTVWHRISSVYKLTAGDTSLSWTLSVANTAGSTSTYFHIDGAQGEYGRIPHKFVDPSDGANTTVLANPLTSGKTIYAIQEESTNAGKSNFLNNYGVKISRLKNTLINYIPHGSSFAIKTGHEDYGYRDLDKSLVPNNSFETTLGDWVGTNATLDRVVARGSEFNEKLSHGQAYCAVTTSGSVPFGIITPNIFITDDGSYYASVALRPGDSSSSGAFDLTVDFYNALNAVVYTKTITKTFTSTDRWAYLADTYSVADISGSSYVKLSVKLTPTAGYVAGQSFHIDRVVFRQ